MLDYDYPSHSISLTVANKPGVLVRVSLVFSRRGYNIDSLVVSPALDGKFARMNISARGNPDTLEQIILQLEKLVDVLHAEDHTGQASVEKELALLKVNCTVQERIGLLQLVNHFGAKTIDLTPTSLIVQISGNSDKIDAFRDNVAQYDMVEFIRTGKIIMMRGNIPT